MLIVDFPVPDKCVVCKALFYLDDENCVCSIANRWMIHDFIRDDDSRPTWCPIKGYMPDTDYNIETVKKHFQHYEAASCETQT